MPNLESLLTPPAMAGLVSAIHVLHVIVRAGGRSGHRRPLLSAGGGNRYHM